MTLRPLLTTALALAATMLAGGPARAEEYYFVSAADYDCLVANSRAYQALEGEVVIVDLRRCPPTGDQYVFPALPMPPGASSPARPDRVLPLRRDQLRCLIERKAPLVRIRSGESTIYRIPVDFRCR